MHPINQKYCQDCGQLINVKAEICPHCGVRQALSPNAAPLSSDRWLIALLLCLFGGVFGIHRFYTGHTAIGIIQLLTGGGCGIWALIDLILIAVNGYTDAQGNTLK